MTYFKVNERCTGCLACVQNCPARALKATEEMDRRTLHHNMARCARCATCWRVCPEDAIEFQHLLINEWDDVVTLSLARCAVCGEVLHTRQLEESLNPEFQEMAELLCARHKTRQAARVLAYSEKLTRTEGDKSTS